MTEKTKRVLVTGATGLQGGAVVQALLRGGHTVTAFVRNPDSDSARVLARQGVAMATGNLDDIASLEAASAGHDAVFSVQLAGVDPTNPGVERRQALNIATAAKRAGVSQIIHTSVSGTGWRSQHPGYVQGDMFQAYWEQKEAAEDAVRQSGVARWTILKPAFFMDNFLPGDNKNLFPELHHLPEGSLATSDGPQTVLALINTDDFGAAVAAVVADPDGFHEAEIEFAGDAMTHTEIAEVISAIANRNVTAVFRNPEEWEQVRGATQRGERTWDDLVGYPARPHHAARYGLSTTTFRQWAARQDWRIPTSEN
ncbi:NmrA family NAD(P)-binding protein [Cellulomonas sp. NPDC055163]